MESAQCLQFGLLKPAAALERNRKGSEGATEGKPQGGTEGIGDEAARQRRRAAGGAARCSRSGRRKVPGEAVRGTGRWLPWSCRSGPGPGCPTRPRLQVAAVRRRRGPEEHGRFRPAGYSGLRRVRARFAPWPCSSTTSSIPQGSARSSSHRSHSSSKVVWDSSNGALTRERTAPPTSWASSSVGVRQHQVGREGAHLARQAPGVDVVHVGHPSTDMMARRSSLRSRSAAWTRAGRRWRHEGCGRPRRGSGRSPPKKHRVDALSRSCRRSRAGSARRRGRTQRSGRQLSCEGIRNAC